MGENCRDSVKIDEQERMDRVADAIALRAIWYAFMRLYPGQKCECYFDSPRDGITNDKTLVKVCFFGGGVPQVHVLSGTPEMERGRALMMGLAQVAVGPEHEKDDKCFAAFEVIQRESEYIGKELFAEWEQR